MIPFCRNPEEGRRLLALMAEHGLVRGERGLQDYVIGSNDLTQLVLGVDRDSELVAPLFDERHPAVLAMVGAVIDTARKLGKKIGMCGQGPSDYPEFTRFLVSRGIDSISLNPDALLRSIGAVLEAERELAIPEAGPAALVPGTGGATR
ncbi:MAG: hypothetical protein HY359_08835 [Candidatus Rokubacteria bacterium]|nr:hypothetical protein [Candidatus Rokubacteria bacterium]